MKYRKKQVEIEAVQFNGTDESVDWLLPQLENGEIGRSCNKLYIKTLEGVMEANIGDYIIKGINGEFYPCKPDIFEKTYVKVGDINPDYTKLAQIAYDTVLQTMIEGEKEHGVDGWKNSDNRNCLHHAFLHLRSMCEGDATEDHIAHAMTNCAMIKYLENR